MCCEGFPPSWTSYKADWRKKSPNLTLSHQHFLPWNCTIVHSGQGCWHVICKSQFCYPRAVTSGEIFFFFEPYKVPVYALVSCTWKAPPLWHSSYPFALAEHAHNEHFTWSTSVSEQLCPPFGWSHYLFIIRTYISLPSDYSDGEFLTKSDTYTWKPKPAKQIVLIYLINLPIKTPPSIVNGGGHWRELKEQ